MARKQLRGRQNHPRQNARGAAGEAVAIVDLEAKPETGTIKQIVVAADRGRDRNGRLGCAGYRLHGSVPIPLLG
jgi:hypothetical protein